MRQNFDFFHIYRKQISPLVQQIHNICDANGIPYQATYTVQFNGSEVHSMDSSINGYHEIYSRTLNRAKKTFKNGSTQSL